MPRSSPAVDLRPYQVRAFQEVVYALRQRHRRQTLCSPTGSGKSLMLCAVSALLLRRPLEILATDQEPVEFRGVVIATPQLQLFDNFLRIERIRIPPGPRPKGHRSHLANLQDFFFQDFSAATPGPTNKEIREFWKRDCSIIVMSHARFRGLDLPKDLSGYLLVLDEAHHAPLSAASHASRRRRTTTKLGRLRDRWVARGGWCIQATATPWHTASGERIYTDEEPLTLVNITELRKGEFIPGNFGFDRVMLKYRAGSLKEWLLETDLNPKLSEAYRRVAEHWVQQRKPYTIIRSPDTRHIPALRRVFEREGARVFDASGTTFDRKALELECNQQDYRKRQFDVVIAPRRFDEGTDLPFISNVYYIGAPTSSRLLVQLLGRALRDKRQLRNYPTRHRDRSGLTIFIPNGKAAAQEYFAAHRNDATLLAAYLADLEVGDRIVAELDPRHRESLVFGVESEDEVRTRSQINKLRGDDFTRAQVRSAMNEIIAKVATEHDEVMGAVDPHLVFDQVLAITDVTLRTRCVAHYIKRVAETDPEIGAELENSWTSALLQQAESGALEGDPHGAYTVMIDAVRVVAAKHKHLHKMSVDRNCLKIISKFTDIDANDIARQLRRLVMSRPTKSEVGRVIATYINLRRTYPRHESGNTDRYGLSGYSFASIDKNWPAFGFKDDRGVPYRSLADYGRALCGMGGTRG